VYQLVVQHPTACILAPYTSRLPDMSVIDSRHNTGWRWWLLITFMGLFAFGFRYYYVIHAEVFQPVDQSNVRGDAVEYYNYARNLSHYGIFSMARANTVPIEGDSFRDPGYPVFLAAWMKLFGQWEPWYAAVLLSQAVLGSLTVVFTLWLGRAWMSLPWLAVAGLLMAVWPHSVVMCSYLLTETQVGFLLALGLLLLRIALDKRSRLMAAASGLVLSLAALTNAVLLPLTTLLAFYLLLRRKINASIFACLLLGGLALTTPWVIRNSLLPSSSTSSEGRALINLVQGSWPSYQDAYAAAMKHDPTGEFIMHVIQNEITLLQGDHVAGLEQIGRRMRRNPSEYIFWYLRKPALFWGWNIRIGQGDIYVYATRNSPFETNPFYRAAKAVTHALNPLLFALALVGSLIAALIDRSKQHSVAAAALTILFVTVVYSTLQAEPRYSIPFRGLEIVLAMFTVHQTTRYLGRLRASPRPKSDNL